MRCYVASRFAERFAVRAIHLRLRARGITPTSRWADTPDHLADTSNPEEARAAALMNDEDIDASDAMLVVATPELGEHACEARYSLALSIPVVWLGRRILSSYRPGVVRVDSLDEAIERLAQFAEIPPWSGDGPDARRLAIWYEVTGGRLPPLEPRHSALPLSVAVNGSARVLSALERVVPPDAAVDEPARGDLVVIETLPAPAHDFTDAEALVDSCPTEPPSGMPEKGAA